MKPACIAIFTVFCLICVVPCTEGVSVNKVLIGSGMMVGGGLLFAFTGPNFSYHGTDAAPIAGLVIFGAGTGIVIWGLVSDSHHESKFQRMMRQQQQAHISFGVFPTRKGVQGGAVLRW